MRVSRVTNTTLTVTVGDVNDNPPVFMRRPYTALVPEVARKLTIFIGEKYN